MPKKKVETTETMEAGNAAVAANAEQQGGSETQQWSNPYKAIVTTATFEMGENRRFKQRVFLFKEKPADEVLAALKENGFTYRANEKSWTIQADAETRRLSDELARQFAGHAASPAMSR
ncbi:MAG TPA: hypothetical protein VGG19_16905 [Tepidisphaeraceae bacterium]|jgi:hypothetical protein